MSDGSATDTVRSKDSDGNDLNNDPVIREIDVEIDGSVYTIRKITKKKFAKNRQTGEMVFKGNEDSWEIDGYPYKKTEFQKWLDERVSVEAVNFCLNPQVFIGQMQKNTTTARNSLLKLSGYSAEEFQKRYPDFDDVVTALKGHTPDELRKVLNRTIKDASGRISLAQSSMQMLKDLSADRVVAESPERAEIEAEMARFKKCLDDKKQKLADIMAEDVPDIQSITYRQHEIVRKANESIMAEHAENQKIALNLSQTMSEKKHVLHTLTLDFAECKKQYTDNANAIADAEKKIADLRSKHYDVQTICPTCGRPLPADEVEKTVKQLKADNQLAIEETEKQKAVLKKQLDYLAGKMRQLQIEYKARKGEVEAFEQQISERQNMLMPIMKTVSDIPEAKALDDEIAKLKKRQQCIDILNKDIRSLEDSVFKLERRIKEIDFEVQMKQKEAEADKKRMEDQQAELKRAQEEYGKAMAMLDRLKEYSMLSNKCLEDYVNSFFSHFQFSLFGETQSGEPFETCQMLVDGIPYGNGLNHGDMILCEIDLARGFQKMMGVNLPIFVDDSESLDEDRIPKLDNQLIVLRRTDDKELTVRGKEM